MYLKLVNTLFGLCLLGTVLGQNDIQVDLEVEKFAVEYTLDKTQKEQINKVFTNQFKKAKVIIYNSTLARTEVREKIDKLKKEKIKELKSILSEEQFDKFQENNN